MSQKRSFAESLHHTDNIYPDSSPPLKKRKTNESVTNVNCTSALLTIQCNYMTMLGHRYPLKYTPYWICGNSSKEKFNVLESCAEPCQPSPLTPDKFLSECRYPLIRFCEIPPSIHFTDQEYSFYADYHEYPYVHSLCVTFETHNIPRTSQYISTKVNALHTEYLSKKKKTCELRLQFEK
eukprot:968227_1